VTTSMNVPGIRWVGVKTRDFSRLSNFFHHVMGLSPILEQPDFIVFELPDGDKLELFGPNGPYSPEQFQPNPVVCGFEVDDLEEARRELEAAGIEMLGPLQYSSSGDGSGWQTFRGPDGLVYEVSQTAKHA
jgi:predicted enzyme related to lactoylglutathione lyase